MQCIACFGTNRIRWCNSNLFAWWILLLAVMCVMELGYHHVKSVVAWVS